MSVSAPCLCVIRQSLTELSVTTALMAVDHRRATRFPGGECVYKLVCVWTCICAGYTFLFVGVYVCVRAHLSVHISVCVCVCVCVSACIHICQYVCVLVCVGGGVCREYKTWAGI